MANQEIAQRRRNLTISSKLATTSLNNSQNRQLFRAMPIHAEQDAMRELRQIHSQQVMRMPIASKQ